jgi:hypothetical protein
VVSYFRPLPMAHDSSLYAMEICCQICLLFGDVQTGLSMVPCFDSLSTSNDSSSDVAEMCCHIYLLYGEVNDSLSMVAYFDSLSTSTDSSSDAAEILPPFAKFTSDISLDYMLFQC